MNKVKSLQKELIKDCKRNKRKAQMQLYDMYCTAMYNVAYNYVKKEDEAQDIMQESFIKAFKNIHSFKNEASFGSWIKRIVINQCLDSFKKTKLDTVNIEDQNVQITDDDNWEVEKNVSVSIIKDCIELLPLNYKNVVKLYLIEGYDHQEVSQILEISEVASRAHLSRGKTKLKELLKSNSYES